MTTTDTVDTLQVLHTVLDTHAKLAVPAASLDLDADLHGAGMSSHASVNVMLALEDALGIEFPDELLNKETFSTTASIFAALQSLQAGE